MIMIGVGALLVLLAAMYFMKSKKNVEMPSGTPMPKSSVWKFLSSGGVTAPPGSNYTLTIHQNGNIVASDKALFPLDAPRYNQNENTITGMINGGSFTFKTSISADGMMSLIDPAGVTAFVLRKEN
jgi:hypothetical protein